MSGLRLEWLDGVATARVEGAPPRDLLALVRFGRSGPGRAEHVYPLPVEHLGGVAAEAWMGAGEVRREARGPVRLAVDGEHLFAATEVEHAGEDLESVSRRAYASLLRVAADTGYPGVLRAWNTISSINAQTGGQERYRLFCKGRAEAYADLWGSGFEGRLPSCSAVGSHGGGLTVQMLASRRPGRSVENPRQISAYRYPDAYGPKSPSFARGLVAPRESGGWIFVSGTASIVGHASVHPGDPAAQTEETMRNVDRVLDEAGAIGGGSGARLRGLRVYLRRREDLPVVRGALERHLESPIPTAWLLADVCREELLVEIEGVAR